MATSRSARPTWSSTARTASPRRDLLPFRHRGAARRTQSLARPLVDPGDELIAGLQGWQWHVEFYTLAHRIAQGLLDFEPPAAFEILQGGQLVGWGLRLHHGPEASDGGYRLGE